MGKLDVGERILKFMRASLFFADRGNHACSCKWFFLFVFFLFLFFFVISKLVFVFESFEREQDL